jgi:hypothetical protein
LASKQCAHEESECGQDLSEQREREVNTGREVQARERRSMRERERERESYVSGPSMDARGRGCASMGTGGGVRSTIATGIILGCFLSLPSHCKRVR